MGAGDAVRHPPEDRGRLAEAALETLFSGGDLAHDARELAIAIGHPEVRDDGAKRDHARCGAMLVGEGEFFDRRALGRAAEGGALHGGSRRDRLGDERAGDEEAEAKERKGGAHGGIEDESRAANASKGFRSPVEHV